MRCCPGAVSCPSGEQGAEEDRSASGGHGGSPLTRSSSPDGPGTEHRRRRSPAPHEGAGALHSAICGDYRVERLGRKKTTASPSSSKDLLGFPRDPRELCASRDPRASPPRDHVSRTRRQADGLEFEGHREKAEVLVRGWLTLGLDSGHMGRGTRVGTLTDFPSDVGGEEPSALVSLRS